MTYLKSSKEVNLRLNTCRKESDGIGCKSNNLHSLFCVG